MAGYCTKCGGTGWRRGASPPQHCDHCEGSGYRKPSKEKHDLMPRCQAITDAQWRSQQNWIKRCENTAAHLVRGVGLCGTHFNAASRKRIEVVAELETLDDQDITGAQNGQRYAAPTAGGHSAPPTNRDPADADDDCAGRQDRGAEP